MVLLVLLTESDGTFGTFGTFGTVERHRRTEVASNGDQNLHTLFLPISPVHSHPLPIACSKGSLVGSLDHMIRSNTNRSIRPVSKVPRWKSLGINGKRDGTFGTFGTFDTFDQSGTPPV